MNPVIFWIHITIWIRFLTDKGLKSSGISEKCIVGVAYEFKIN